MDLEQIWKQTESYYNEKIRLHGPVARGVDWNSLESQTQRFTQLLKICDASKPFSINDYGCGYGALVGFLQEQGCSFEYCGYDISSEMIAQAEQLHGKNEQVLFTSKERNVPVADYTVASGIFNVKLTTSDDAWQAYLLRTLARLSELSTKGFAFNVLTKYSDSDRMRPELYYADPLMLFDYCKRNFSRFVALLHDYPLYEFTILVKK